MKKTEDLTKGELIAEIIEARNDSKNLSDARRELATKVQRKREIVEKYSGKQNKEDLAELEERLSCLTEAQKMQWGNVKYFQEEIDGKDEQRERAAQR